MPELAIIIPTYKEADNVGPLIGLLEAALAGLDWEVILVDDDSPDGTFETIERISEANPRVHGIRRVGRRGLSSACIEGMLVSDAPFLAVMDADHQHDERILPDMLELLRSDEVDVAVGSRYVGGGSSSGGLGPLRSAGSRLATALSHAVTRHRLRDPMSGFFMIRREVLQRTVNQLYGEGFKILLDILSSYDGPLRLREFPYEMKARHTGESKLDTSVVADFLMLLLASKFNKVIPLRFFLFVGVGLTGVGVHMGTLYAIHSVLGQQFVWSQALATWVAMSSNFFLNNLFTFRDRRLRGTDALRGLFSFYLACGIGAVINVALAGFLFDRGMVWALAGLLGAVVAAVWNFSLASYFTWRRTLNT